MGMGMSGEAASLLVGTVSAEVDGAAAAFVSPLLLLVVLVVTFVADDADEDDDATVIGGNTGASHRMSMLAISCEV